MLTSSEAKWRCLWHLLLWALLVTFVSQLLHLKDHIAFYILASLSVIILPLLTAVYSNTAGRKGAGLLRVAYVILDPVLACLAITPVRLVHHLPAVMGRAYCYYHYRDPNDTATCLRNPELLEHDHDEENVTSYHYHTALLTKQKEEFLVLQSCILLPVIFALFMGRRSRKMSFNTLILSFVYWFICAIEAVTLLETALLWEQYKHMVFTTEIMVSISMILANSYAVVTLCSYITPNSQTGNSKKHEEKFDFIYQIFIGVAGVFFTEIPFIVARFQVIFVNVKVMLPGSFYFWMVKDFLFIILLVLLMVLDRYGNKLVNRFSKQCQPEFDKLVFFKPEKRDVYIQQKRKVRFREPIEEDENQDEKLNCDNTDKLDKEEIMIDTKANIVENNELNSLSNSDDLDSQVKEITKIKYQDELKCDSHEKENLDTNGGVIKGRKRSNAQKKTMERTSDTDSNSIEHIELEKTIK